MHDLNNTQAGSANAEASRGLAIADGDLGTSAKILVTHQLAKELRAAIAALEAAGNRPLELQIILADVTRALKRQAVRQ